MRFRRLAFLITILILSLNTFGQGGGKAEPLRISFEKGKTSKTVSGTLKNTEEYEYIFGAAAGQNVKLKIRSTQPKGRFHAFRILGSEEIDFASDYDVTYDLEFVAPESGDYLIFVHFRPTETVRSGRFWLTLSIE